MEVSTLSHLTNSALVVYLLEYLKTTDWYQRFATALPIENRKVHILMSAIGAGATSMGMHGAVVGSVAIGYTFTVSIPPLWILAHALWDWTQQMALQQLGYDLVVKRKAAAAVLTTTVAPDTTVTAPLKDIKAALAATP